MPELVTLNIEVFDRCHRKTSETYVFIIIDNWKYFKLNLLNYYKTSKFIDDSCTRESTYNVVWH